MSKKTEALAEDSAGTEQPSNHYDDVRESMRQAFEQPAQQQCWCTTCRPITVTDMRFVVCPECGNKRCPKANDHRNTCTGSNDVGQKGSSWEHVKPAGEQPAQQQEPVAWRVRWPRMGGGYKWIMNDAPLMAEHGFINEPLYTSPPASKPWVGLTAVERHAILQRNDFGADGGYDGSGIAEDTENKLREKNA